MVVGLSLPFGVGDVVRLIATTNPDREPLVGCRGEVVAVQPGSRLVLAEVRFEPTDEQQPELPAQASPTVLVRDVDELELVERYRHYQRG